MVGWKVREGASVDVDVLENKYGVGAHHSRHLALVREVMLKRHAEFQSQQERSYNVPEHEVLCNEARGEFDRDVKVQ